ncbi:hypothetical protein TWF970_008380 [Orbilia oligospora]|uniref:Thioesterase domain-containing protein n=1 Tax=Orbilia oligospora TaxID=2813651 RepID=A0A7C8VJD9_ORBOL|nr:hypothetical protein TWF970_008380 [Orbilia oligospora]KAF3273786.1 hypothetical protein TWF970_008380 [Orbilia oligospora]KAF3273787.1 hypothetical protein TWF970_008380 [Orbilia oligospora]
MAGLLSRSLLRAGTSIAPKQTYSTLRNSTRAQNLSQRIYAQASLKSYPRTFATSPQKQQYRTHTYDSGDGNPPVKIQIQEPPSFFKRSFHFIGRVLGGILIVTFGSVIALVIYEPDMIVATEVVRMAMHPEEGVSDERTLQIESYIQNHPIVQKFRDDPSLIETRPHLDIPTLLRPNVLTAGVLTGPDRIAVPPLVFADGEGKKLYAILHVGEQLCGHPGVVHGGLLATLMDETLARCCFPALPNKIAMTANLDVNYRAPCKANQFVIIKAETTKVEGRKAWVSGRLESLPAPGADADGRLLVEASVLMIEPKNIGVLMREVPNKDSVSASPRAAVRGA